MIIFVLFALLCVLAIIVGKKRGKKAVLSLVLNAFIMLMTLVFINIGFDLIIICYLSSILIAVVTIYFLNGKNVKTDCSFISIILVIMIMSAVIFYFNSKMNTAGFSYESVESISVFSFNISLDLEKIAFVIIMLATVGAICDTSMCISSSLYEINENKKMKPRELFISGMNVGKDILGTTVNTLFFAFISGFIGFLLWHNYNDIVTLVNYSAFASNVLEILCSAIGCIIIIPVTALIMIYFLRFKKHHK